jgi:hypothetical protein
MVPPDSHASTPPAGCGRSQGRRDGKPEFGRTTLTRRSPQCRCMKMRSGIVAAPRGWSVRIRRPGSLPGPARCLQKGDLDGGQALHRRRRRCSLQAALNPVSISCLAASVTTGSDGSCDPDDPGNAMTGTRLASRCDQNSCSAPSRATVSAGILWQGSSDPHPTSRIQPVEPERVVHGSPAKVDVVKHRTGQTDVAAWLVCPIVDPDPERSAATAP